MRALAFDLNAPGSAPPRRLFAVPEAAPVAAFPGTLDAVFTSVWGAVARGQVAVCPVCAGTLRAHWTAGTGAVGGRCDDCGSTLD